jgi:hypothetical protein
MRIIHGVEARFVVGDFIGGHSYLRPEGFRFGLAVSAAWPKDAPVIRPVRLKVEPASWGNALGFQFTGAGLTAFFNPDDLPRDPLDLIILTSGREQRYVLKESDRLQIR